MKKELFFILAGICIITHIVRTIYEIIKHKKLLKPGKLSFIIIFTNMILLWASWFGLCSIDPYSVTIPAALRYLGIILAGLGVVSFLTALSTIKSLESYEGDLISHGIYAKIRHPMYLGFILWLLGMPLYSGGILSFILAVVFTANVLFWRYLEEIELVSRFTGYRKYKRKTIF